MAEKKAASKISQAILSTWEAIRDHTSKYNNQWIWSCIVVGFILEYWFGVSS